MNTAHIALFSLIGLGFFTLVLQFFIYKEEILTDDFLVFDKKKEEVESEEYDSEAFKNKIDPLCSDKNQYWVVLKKAGVILELNNEELFNKGAKDETVTINYKKSYWKLGRKQIIMGYQLLGIIDK